MEISTHVLSDWVVIQIFYNGLTCATELNIDPVTDGALMNKSPENAWKLIEVMAFNQSRWADNEGNSSRLAGMPEN